jgi:hypothetical protein
MEIILDHQYNGAMVAYSAAEAAEWEKKGWKIRQPKAVVEPVAKPETVAEPEVVRVRRPRGVQ